MTDAIDALKVAGGNRWLAALPPAVREHVLSQSQTSVMVRGGVLAERGKAAKHVVFPLDGLAAIDTSVGAERNVVVGLVGPDGAIGLEALLAPGLPGAGRVLALTSCRAVWLPADALRTLAAQYSVLHKLCLLAARCELLEVSQIAACNARHSLEARCARWLLAMQAGLRADDLPVTHEFLASALGVRRAGVTTTVGAFQRAGLVTQGRGRIVVRDQGALERAACSCHADLRERFASVWPCQAPAKKPPDPGLPGYAPGFCREASDAAIERSTGAV